MDCLPSVLIQMVEGDRQELNADTATYTIQVG